MRHTMHSTVRVLFREMSMSVDQVAAILKDGDCDLVPRLLADPDYEGSVLRTTLDVGGFERTNANGVENNFQVLEGHFQVRVLDRWSQYWRAWFRESDTH